MSNETLRINGGSTRGNIDIIRIINEIPDRTHINDLFKMKTSNQNTADTPVVKDAVTEKISKSTANNSKAPADLKTVSKNVNLQPLPAARIVFAKGGKQWNIDNLQEPFNGNNNNQSHSEFAEMLLNIYIALPSGNYVSLRQFGETFIRSVTDGYRFQVVILTMADHFSEYSFVFLIKLVQQFMERSLGDILHVLKVVISTESVLFRILKHVLDNYQDLHYDFLCTQAREIQRGIREYYLSLNPNNDEKLLKQCSDCRGKFYECDL